MTPVGWTEWGDLTVDGAPLGRSIAKTYRRFSTESKLGVIESNLAIIRDAWSRKVIGYAVGGVSQIQLKFG